MSTKKALQDGLFRPFGQSPAAVPTRFPQETTGTGQQVNRSPAGFILARFILDLPKDRLRLGVELRPLEQIGPFPPRRP
jgi:hypothetical protein